MYPEYCCCVPNCKRPRSPGTPLHGFPNPITDSERFRTWLYSIGGDILGLDNEYIYKYRNVCRHHFEPKYLLGHKRLANTAIPTLNMPGIFGTRRQPMADITRRTLNVEENIIETPSTSREVTGHQMPVTHDSPKTTLKTGAVKNKDPGAVKYKKDTCAMAKTIAKLKLAKANYARRLRKAMKLTENTSFQKMLQNFTTLAGIFTLMQFREIKKPKMGRRFTQNEKIMALSLYKQGPKAYRWLSKVFVLPSPMTLSRLISRTGLVPGVNEKIFLQLKEVGKKMSVDDKLVVLLFDEIALTPHFDYNKKKDKISGFVDNGKKNELSIADHALVFMIRGIYRNFKQPISYTFCSGSTKRQELAQQIKENISKLQSIGFKVLATVCDQGASNVSALNHLIGETRADYLKRDKEFRHEIFTVNNQEIIPLYDPPHLIKGIRNNLLNKNLKCKIDGETKIAKWEHLRLLYEENPAYKGIRLVKNLSEVHVNPEKLNKQKVKYATQIFSQTVASSMGYLAEKNILPKECKETADIILFFDQLFDSINGSYDNSKKRSGKELLRQLTPKSKHEQVWAESKKVLSTMKFITSIGRECTPPSILNWIKTINNLQYLKYKLFSEYNLKSIWLRHFNQDPLENFFGCIRSQGAQNTKPSCAAFEGAFAALLINSINSTYSPGSNCENDSCKVFKQINKLIEKSESKNKNETTEINYSHIDMNVIVDLNVKKESPRIIAALDYVTGYVLRKASKIFKSCNNCQKALYTTEDTPSIKIREYSGRRWLTYPSNDMIECFSAIQDVAINILRTASYMNNIKQYIKTVLYIVINYEFLTCKLHKKDIIDFIFDLSARFFICNWCRDVNKLLNGTRHDNDLEDCMQIKCVDYYKKRRKK